jgi:hypothetical protein
MTTAQHPAGFDARIKRARRVAAIAARYWFLWVRCPACRTIKAIDLRTLEVTTTRPCRASSPPCRVAHVGRTLRLPSSSGYQRPASLTKCVTSIGGGCLASRARGSCGCENAGPALPLTPAPQGYDLPGCRHWLWGVLATNSSTGIVCSSFRHDCRRVVSLFDGTPAGGSTTAEAQADPGGGRINPRARTPLFQFDHLQRRSQVPW